MTVQTMFHVAGQLNVNHRFVSFAFSVPVNCTAQIGFTNQPSTGISHTPRFRVPARNTRAYG